MVVVDIAERAPTILLLNRLSIQTICKSATVAMMRRGCLLGEGNAYAQSINTPRIEIGILPAGGTLLTEGDSGTPSFSTYALAGSVTINASRFVGMLFYTGNLVFYPGGRDRRGVAYVTGGAGGLTLFKRAAVGVPENATLFAGNGCGGLKINISDRWRIRKGLPLRIRRLET